MKASVCMASYNRDPDVLRQVLESVCSQRPPFPFEVIVADDGSEFGAPEVCKDFPVIYHRIDREGGTRSSSVGHNAAWRRATGEIVIAQSDDVVHQQSDSIERLVDLIEAHSRTFVIACVLAFKDGKEVGVLTGIWGHKRRRAPYFFLGAVYREDLFAVGGDDEDFARSGGQAWDDVWLADCLQKGRNLTPLYTQEVLAYHIEHPTRVDPDKYDIARRVYSEKKAKAEASGVWISSGGPWEHA